MGHPDIYASKMEGIAETGKEPTVDSINWTMTLLDSSRLATLAVAIFLIIYGSFRAIKSDKNKEDADDEETNSIDAFWEQGHTIESSQALLLPFGASLSLLIMFFFFDSLQLLFTLMTAGELTLPSLPSSLKLYWLPIQSLFS